ncbi:hypothetical protein N0V90_007359 [Kalmusia sp. IMI 367209]|nr:hypothetical protein N0V90_007359 [Kalmusia sp. IMI 367209]
MARQPTFSRRHGGQQGTGSDGRTAQYSHWMLHNTFYGLVITTTLATTLLAADRYQWRATGVVFRVANQFPASAAFTVQLLAAFFGVIHVAVVCKLINYALRLRLTKASVSLDVLRTWVDMSIPRVDWDLPLRFFFPVLFAVFLSLVPAALWAGSFTPLVSSTPIDIYVTVPSYGNVSLIREYPMEIGKAGPSFRSQRGLFTYSVGQQLIGPLLSSAAGASTNDSANLLHAKIDNTQYSYTGRSYGVGSVAGLGDGEIAQFPNAAGYMYQEEGYITNVTCIYNQTSNFTLSGPVNEWIYSAAGSLPDSVEGPEYSNYIGHNAKAIVAMGVAYSELSPRRYVAITAGESYAHLNNTQCELAFTPTLFNVTVDMSNFNITVRPDRTVADFNPERNITRTVVRQFELLSNDLTNLYVSLLGEALNSSVAAYAMIPWSPPLTPEDITLGGLTNSITAMADDMLVAYASAQLMVGREYAARPARVYVYALQFGQPAYIYAIFALNLFIICAVLVEAVRTRGWSRLTRFNYLDPRDLVIAASRGGTHLARAADHMVAQEGQKMPKHVWLLSDPDEGNGRLVVRVAGDREGHAAIEVDAGRSEGLMGDGWVSYEGSKLTRRSVWRRRRGVGGRRKGGHLRGRGVKGVIAW